MAAFKRCFSEEAKPGQILAKDAVTTDQRVILNAGTVLTEENIRRIQSWGIPWLTLRKETEKETTSIIERAYNRYKETLEDVRKSFDSVRQLGEIPVRKMQELSDTKLLPLTETPGVLTYIYRMRRKDRYTFEHSVNVALLAGTLGKWLGYKGQDLRNIVLAGLLHDIGKTRIPLMVLNKPGKLTEAEMLVMKGHAQLGYDLLKKLPGLPPDVAIGAWQHHERLDGNGYPQNLQGTEISFIGKLLAVVDVYDALTSDRVYRKKMTPLLVLEKLLDERRDKLDAQMCTTFVYNVQDYLIGNRVRLSNGEDAEVIRIGTAIGCRPLVRTASGKFIDLEQEKNIAIIDLIKS